MIPLSSLSTSKPRASLIPRHATIAHSIGLLLNRWNEICSHMKNKKLLMLFSLAVGAISCQQELPVDKAAAPDAAREPPPSRAAFFPAWSPGTRLAFVSDRDGNWEIYVMNADGSQPSRLTHSAERDSNPSWSPDASHIYFYSDRTGDREVFVMENSGDAPQFLRTVPALPGIRNAMATVKSMSCIRMGPRPLT
jgi:hypothetical protein